jgi:MFS family permease
VGYSKGLNVSVYVGMLIGALFWGFTADIIGRRWAFNISLFICSACAILAGAMPNWGSLGFFIALVGFGAGGNLIMDTTVFLEYLPGNKQWALTFLASWWGLGQAITGFIAWGFMGEFRLSFSCLFGSEQCTCLRGARRSQEGAE